MSVADSVPEASVVIPWRGEESVRECLHRLGSPSGIEIIVVDNRPAAQSSDLPGVIHEPCPGPASARNRGIRESRGEYVLFIDADCIPDEHWAVRMLEQIRSTGADGVQGPILSQQREPVARFIQAEFDQRQSRLQQHQSIALVSTGNSAFRKKALQEAGGFDPQARAGEDTELSFRLLKRGCRLKYVSAPVVWHQHPTRILYLLRRKYWYGHWLAMVYLRYPSRIVENTRTPRAQLISIGLWLAWLPLVLLWGWLGLIAVPLATLLLALPLVPKAGMIALLLAPAGCLMNAMGLLTGGAAVLRGALSPGGR